MTEDGPDFAELVGDDLAPGERERLRRVHELLLEVGPPPELTPRLEAPPAERHGTLVTFSRRRRSLLVLAAALALALFGGGWLVGSRSNGSHPVRTVAMTGPGGAHAALAIFADDRAGNWPMKITVRGLAALPRGRTYSLWLTRRGRLEAPCGIFTVGRGATAAHLNAPYRLSEYDGWVVVRTGTTQPLLTTNVT